MDADLKRSGQTGRSAFLEHARTLEYPVRRLDKRHSAIALIALHEYDQAGRVKLYLSGKKEEVQKAAPSDRDFRSVARFYNGPKYEAHHYHEQLARWHREFKMLMG